MKYRTKLHRFVIIVGHGYRVGKTADKVLIVAARFASASFLVFPVRALFELADHAPLDEVRGLADYDVKTPIASETLCDDGSARPPLFFHAYSI
jgi:hypothetical protein